MMQVLLNSTGPHRRRVRFTLPGDDKAEDDDAELASASSTTSASPIPIAAHEDDGTMPWIADFSDLQPSMFENMPSQPKIFQTKSKEVARRPKHYEQPPPLTPQDREMLWYSKKELAVHRKDVRRTILFLRNCGGVDLLTEPEYKVDTLAGMSDTHEICFRGCERYFSLETRFMIQKTVVDAVLEAQENLEDELELRHLSESLSESCKELAAWHAKLNAVQCWGLRGLRSAEAHTKSKSNTNKRPKDQAGATSISQARSSSRSQEPFQVPTKIAASFSSSSSSSSSEQQVQTPMPSATTTRVVPDTTSTAPITLNPGVEKIQCPNRSQPPPVSHALQVRQRSWQKQQQHLQSQQTEHAGSKQPPRPTGAAAAELTTAALADSPFDLFPPLTSYNKAAPSLHSPAKHSPLPPMTSITIPMT